MTGEIPVLDALAGITAASVKHHPFAPRQFMLPLVRMAALIEVDAPPASHLPQRRRRGQRVTADDTQAVMIAVAPVAGTARVVSAAGNILRAPWA